MGDQDYWGNVRHYLNRAKQVHVMNPTDDEEMIKHIEEILAEVGEEAETNDVKEDLTLAEDDHEKAEKIANILDQEGENLEPESMESQHEIKSSFYHVKTYHIIISKS